MALKAVIFDMDGVLCATIEYHYQSWKKVTDEYQIPFSRQDNEKLLGLTRRHSLEVILKEMQLSEDVMHLILKKKNHYYLKLIEDMSPADLLPGVDPLLKELVASGLKIGVASGSSNSQLVLKKLQIDGYIDAVVDGNHVRRSKPYPDVFLKTAWKLKVGPRSCLVLEDSRAGIRAARAAQMCVVGLGPPERVKHAHADYPDLSRVSMENLKNVYQQWREGKTIEWKAMR